MKKWYKNTDEHTKGYIVIVLSLLIVCGVMFIF